MSNIFSSIRSMFLYKHSCFIILSVLSLLLRIVFLDKVPGNGGLLPDEAFNAFESFSLLNYGIDSHGYSYPVYFISNGSGQSVLQAYFMIPFIKFLGLNVFSIRLPQALLWWISVNIFYFLLRYSLSKKFALLGMLILATSPWHLMSSRYALDCNFFPSFFLIGTFFLFLSLKTPIYLILSSFFFGLSLYCHACPWFVIPFILLSFLYFYKVNTDRFNTYIFISSALILFLVALPLLFFVLVNYFNVKEFSFCGLSIPKLFHIRGQAFDFSIRSISHYVNSSFNMILFQQESNQIYTSIPKYGFFYFFAPLIALIGICSSIEKFSIKKSKYNFMNGIMLSWLFCSLPMLFCMVASAGRLNILLYPFAYFLLIGLKVIVSKIGENFFKVFFVYYSFCFISFFSYYMTEYNHLISSHYRQGCNESLDYINKSTTNVKKIFVSSEISYPNILFFSQIDTKEYIDTVNIKNINDEFFTMVSFGNYYFGDFTEMNAVKGNAFMCFQNDVTSSEKMTH